MLLSNHPIFESLSIFKEAEYPSTEVMASTGSSSFPLTAQYDDMISCTNVLLPGTEGGENFGI